jgi:hypothetical protein
MSGRKLAELWDLSEGLGAGAYELRVGGELVGKGRKVCELWEHPDGLELRAIVGAFHFETLRASDERQAEMAAEFESIEALRLFLNGTAPVINVGQVGAELHAAQRKAIDAAREIVAAADEAAAGR